MDLRETLYQDLQALSAGLQDRAATADDVSLYRLLIEEIRSLESRPAQAALDTINSRLTRVESAVARLGAADTFSKGMHA